MSGFKYIELKNETVSQEVLQKFDCGHPDFNNFIKKEAVECKNNGEGVTYILVLEEEYEQNNITSVFAFATLQATALLYHDAVDEEKIMRISGVEIKYFAISRGFQKQYAYLLDGSKYYSTCFLEILLMDLYSMSIEILGFQTIFLRANQNGERLYRRKNFIDASKYIRTQEEDDPMGKCIPMLLMIQENLHNIFA